MARGGGYFGGKLGESLGTVTVSGGILHLLAQQPAEIKVRKVFSVAPLQQGNR